MPWYGWIILGLTVVGMVAIGIAATLRRRKDDKGFLEGLRAWDPEALPFIVMLDVDIPPARSLELAIEEAVKFWRSQVPEVELFKKYNDLDGGGKMISIMPLSKLAEPEGKECCSDRFGYANLMLKDGRLWSAGVYIDTDRMRELSHEALTRAIAHELGHCLGLAHDNIPHSVMWPKVPSNEAPIVTENDRTALIALYA